MTVSVSCFRSPTSFFKKAAAQAGITLGGEREYGVGMFFFPQDELARKQAMKMFEIIVEKEGLDLPWMERCSYNTGCH